MGYRAIVPSDEIGWTAARGQSARNCRRADEADGDRRQGGLRHPAELVQARDGSAEPASIAFSKPEIAVLDQLNGEIEGKTALQKNPHARHSLAWASWIIARMGGWNGYPSSRPPGPIAMRNGWEYFSAIARGWTLRDARLL